MQSVNCMFHYLCQAVNIVHIIQSYVMRPKLQSTKLVSYRIFICWPAAKKITTNLYLQRLTFRPSLAWQFTFKGVNKAISFSSLPLLQRRNGRERKSLIEYMKWSFTLTSCSQSTLCAFWLRKFLLQLLPLKYDYINIYNRIIYRILNIINFPNCCNIPQATINSLQPCTRAITYM